MTTNQLDKELEELRELAIKVAIRLNEYELNFFHEAEINKYLHDKAAQIHFSKGVAARIGYAVFKEYKEMGFTLESCVLEERNWWRTLTPQKMLEVWLEMENE